MMTNYYESEWLKVTSYRLHVSILVYSNLFGQNWYFFHSLPDINAPLPKRFNFATFPRSADLYKRASPANENEEKHLE